MTNAYAMTCRFFCRSPPHPPLSPPPSPFSLIFHRRTTPGTPHHPPEPDPNPCFREPGTPIETCTPLRRIPPVKTTPSFLPELKGRFKSTDLEAQGFGPCRLRPPCRKRSPAKGVIELPLLRRGGGRKVGALPRKFVFLGFQMEEPGMSRDFCLRLDVPDPWGCSRSLCKKSSCSFFGPYLRNHSFANFREIWPVCKQVTKSRLSPAHVLLLPPYKGKKQRSSYELPVVHMSNGIF